MEYISVDYTNEMGENPLTEEMRNVLSGLSLEKQIEYFIIEEDTHRGESDYGEVSSWSEQRSYPLKTVLERSDFDVNVGKLILCDGMIVGVYFYGREYPVLLNEWFCTYSDSEEDGPWSAWISVSKRIVFVNNPA